MSKIKNPVVRYALTGMALLTGVILWTSCVQQPAEEAPASTKPMATQKENLVERGKYLVTVAGCQDCHTPHDKDGQIIKGKEFTGHWKGAPEPKWDPSMLKKNTLMLVGLDFTSFAGPWGLSKAKNLTPDKETGIGNLTEEQFVDLFKRGTLMPPMPIQWISHMKDDDLKAIYTYLRTLPPVNNGAVEAPITATTEKKK